MTEAPAPELLFDRYQLLSTLGRSPWYRQYLAQDFKRNESVVVKILKVGPDPPDVLGQFREWYAASVLGAPGVVPVRAMHIQGDQLYVVESLPEGQPWRNWIGQKPNPSALVPKVDALLQRVEGLHQRGIPHNCILPENCWWHPREGWMLADAGWLRWCFLNGLAPVEGAAPEAWTSMVDAHQLGALFAYTLLGIEIASTDLPLRATTELKRRARKLPDPWPGCLLQLWGPAVTEEWSPISAARMALGATPSSANNDIHHPAGARRGPADLPITGSIASAAAISAGGAHDTPQRDRPLTQDVDIEPSGRLSGRTSGMATAVGGLDPKARRRESTILARAALGLYVITLAFALGILWAMGNFLFRATVTPVPVPDIIGMSVTAAKQAAEPKGFQVTVNGAEYSAEFPQGKILRQSPGPNTTVKEFREIFVTLSRGGRTIKLPSLIGLSEEEAKNSLIKLDLKVGQVSAQYTRDSTAGKVIDQDPPANFMLAKEEPVNLVISRGVLRGEISMPDLGGRTLTQALAQLNDARLRVRRIVRRYSNDAVTTTVSLQSPTAAALVEEGTEVFLTVTAPRSQEPLGEFQVRIVTELPAFEGKKDVRITLHDGRGESHVYNESHAGGDRIERLVDAYQTTRIFIYLDGKLIREEQY